MLIRDLYSTEFFNKNDNKVTASITIDPLHPIFEGHFPKQPVLPGVCQIQIVKEMVEKATEVRLFLTEASKCKFLEMANPFKTNVLNVAIDYEMNQNSVVVNATIQGDGHTFLKMVAMFTIISE